MLGVCRQVTVRRSGTDIQLCVVNYKGVGLGQEGNGASGLRVPGNGTDGARNALVHGYGVGGRVCGTGGQDIDGGRGDGQAGVVPGEGHVLADSVV